MNLAFFIARRTAQHTPDNKPGVMERIAVISVALSVAVMILAMAVIMGFKYEVARKVTAFAAHAVVTDVRGVGTLDSEPVRRSARTEGLIRSTRGFASMAPYAVKGGIVRTADAVGEVMLKGVDTAYDWSAFRGWLVDGDLPRVGDSIRTKDILLSRSLADRLMLGVGDRVEMLFVEAGDTPRRDRFKVAGIYSSGMDEMDNTVILTDLRNVQRLSDWAPDDRKFHVAVAREDYRPDGLLRDGEKNPRGRYFAGRRFVCGRGARGAGFGKKFGRDGAVVGIFEYLWAVLAGREKLSGRVMRRLTTFIAVIFAAAAFAPLRAQSLDAFKERLAAPVVSDAAFGTARVTVTEYGDAEKAVDDASRVGQRLRLRGYRVCIFFDNGQDARAGAFAAEALFKETYPGIMVYPVYENPYFKVVVGNCLTAEEAIILKGKIASTFPKAFVKSEEFSMADLLN